MKKKLIYSNCCGIESSTELQEVQNDEGIIEYFGKCPECKENCEFVIQFIETDPDENQWGRQLSDTVFEFYQPNNGDEENPVRIDLDTYEMVEIESCINPYGYSLLPWSENYIGKQYPNPDEMSWIIAECIFEFNCEHDPEENLQAKEWKDYQKREKSYSPSDGIKDAIASGHSNYPPGTNPDDL